MTFGDPNKFFCAVFAEDPSRSIADCIIDIFPYSIGETYNEIINRKTFVIERVYGERTPSILLGTISAIIKKKKEGNITDIDILVSDEAISSCGLKKKEVEDLLDTGVYTVNYIDNAQINILESPSGDGYYEIKKGVHGKQKGPTKVGGILIKTI